MQSVSDDNVWKRLLEKPRFELAAIAAKGVFRLRSRRSRRTYLERVYNKVVVGGEHVESVMTSVEACLTGGPGKRQLRDDVLQYPRLLVWRCLLDDVVERQCALVRVRVIQVTFRIRKVTTRLQSQRKQLSLFDVCIVLEAKLVFLRICRIGYK